MGDTFQSVPGSDGFRSVTDYEPYLREVHNSLTGRRYKLVQAGQTRLPDGTVQDQWIEQLQEPDPSTQAVGDVGADYIVGELREFLNKHAGMGNLENDMRCRQQAAQVTNNIICEIVSSPTTYGCTDEKFSMLTFRMNNITRSLYQCFTSQKGGKLLDFGVRTTGSQTTTRVDTEPENSNSGILRSRI